MRVRHIFLCCGLFSVSVALGATGEYQQTKNGKTTVWNGTPRPGETAAWEGARDKEGYATGFGTLTWYTAKGAVYGLYYGNMNHGKFDGPVNVHSHGKTAHALFADGGRVTTWVRGPAPSRMAVPEAAAKETQTAEQRARTSQPITSELTKKTKRAEQSPAEPEKIQPIDQAAEKPTATPNSPPAEQLTSPSTFTEPDRIEPNQLKESPAAEATPESHPSSTIPESPQNEPPSPPP